MDLREVKSLKKLHHPNVVKLLETFDTDKHHLIVMELCPGGDLLNYVRKRRKLKKKNRYQLLVLSLEAMLLKLFSKLQK